MLIRCSRHFHLQKFHRSVTHSLQLKRSTLHGLNELNVNIMHPSMMRSMPPLKSWRNTMERRLLTPMPILWPCIHSLSLFLKIAKQIQYSIEFVYKNVTFQEVLVKRITKGGNRSGAKNCMLAHSLCSHLKAYFSLHQFQERFEDLNKESTSEIRSPKKKKKLDHLLCELDTDSDNSDYSK